MVHYRLRLNGIGFWAIRKAESFHFLYINVEKLKDGIVRCIVKALYAGIFVQCTSF